VFVAENGPVRVSHSAIWAPSFYRMTACGATDSVLSPAKKTTSPAENDASMKVKMIGIQSKIIFWVGSGGAGLSFIWNHIVMPMMMGQAPRCRNWPTIGSAVGSHGTSQNRLKMFDGSGAERSWIQPKNGAWRISMVMNSTL